MGSWLNYMKMWKNKCKGRGKEKKKLNKVEYHKAT